MYCLFTDEADFFYVTTTMQDIDFFQANGYRDIQFLECYSFNSSFPLEMVNLAKLFIRMKSTENKLAKFFVKKVALLGLGRFALRHDKFHAQSFEIQNLAHFQLVQASDNCQMLCHVNKRLFGIAKTETRKDQKIRSAYRFNICPVIFSEVVTRIRQEMYKFESFLATQNQLFHIRTDCDCLTVLFPKKLKYILSNYLSKSTIFSYKIEGKSFIQCTSFKRCKYVLIDCDQCLTFKCFGLSLSLFDRYCKNMSPENGTVEYTDFIYRSIIVKDNSVVFTLK